jgi:flagellar FliL protein
MKRLVPIFKTIGLVLQGLALATVFAVNALMGYIMFAPDDLPKPFYLNYSAESATPLATDEHAAVADAHAVEATPEPVEPGDGLMVNTGTKIVNLADPGGRRYLKATITIEVTPPAASTEAAETSSGGHGSTETTEDPALTEFNDQVNQRMPIINDVLTTILSGQTFESIYTLEGKEDLRQEILTQLNDRLPELGVIAVYFTEFVVQ